MPDGVAGCAGIVEHPEHVLSPNVNFAYLGSQNTIGGFRDRALPAMVNGICINMKKVK